MHSIYHDAFENNGGQSCHYHHSSVNPNACFPKLSFPNLSFKFRFPNLSFKSPRLLKMRRVASCDLNGLNLLNFSFHQFLVVHKAWNLARAWSWHEGGDSIVEATAEGAVNATEAMEVVGEILHGSKRLFL
ncbi:hypothetical protein VNO80_25419 [Phaseolus coccineus]|uniref:Uncharacterized protein n=1 Tax=Phaseolus coccineus TaxID=3886 RepID=A0AAN9LU83_PHACN